MHYLGMAAMNMSAHVSYDPLLVALSLVIAVARGDDGPVVQPAGTRGRRHDGAALLMASR
ncbi:hypothetical protein GCM10017559_76630 [Streptosporangium longisporum]|uniref:MHYT domain-containing protein n=1 Tax=Streptosporangium longisporum TaxID=46187 RepID=A0ABP6LE85_9ACTN